MLVTIDLASLLAAGGGYRGHHPRHQLLRRNALHAGGHRHPGAGRSRSTRGLIVSGLIYGTVENLALLFVPSRWASPLAFGIFVVAVLIRSNPTRNALERLGGGL